MSGGHEFCSAAGPLLPQTHQSIDIFIYFQSTLKGDIKQMKPAPEAPAATTGTFSMDVACKTGFAG